MKKTLALLLSAMMVLPAASIAAPKDKTGNNDLNLKQNKSEWTLVWSDEFNGTEIDRSKWTYDIGNWIVDENGNGITSGWGNNEKE
ncbi:hypothetical protein M3172_13680 [Mesobacillus subterraneus]|uniref:glycoside hydrolase family 16 protein n=2 Tax=Mesobacillus TaxID=2675231 RepID=UPI00203FA16E|nr:hypothetical protein [Mesobacillus subterraneus]MCM3574239.1 hypothetical protein [Mesobacillus subterraneus]